MIIGFLPGCHGMESCVGSPWHNARVVINVESMLVMNVGRSVNAVLLKCSVQRCV